MGKVFACGAMLALAMALTAANGAEPPAPELSAATPASAEEIELTITLAGDTGLNGSFEPVYAGFASKHGARVDWREASAAIAPEIGGDIVFANLETVVTDRNDLEPNPKRFGFRTHPDAVRHLTRLGFNVFSTANNHAMDFGLPGARETLKHLAAIATESGLVAVGLGANRAEAGAPHVLTRRGARVAVGALGIIGSGYASPAGD